MQYMAAAIGRLNRPISLDRFLGFKICSNSSKNRNYKRYLRVQKPSKKFSPKTVFLDTLPQPEPHFPGLQFPDQSGRSQPVASKHALMGLSTGRSPNTP